MANRFEEGLAGLAAGDTSVNLSWCDLRDAGAVRVAEGVKASRTLTILDLHCECGRGRGTELARGAVFMRALRRRVQTTRSAMSVPRRSRRA